MGWWSWLTNKRNQSNWNIIIKFTKKYSKKTLLFNRNPTPKKPDSIFLKYNILAPAFKDEEEKYLRNIDFIIENCLEIKNRITCRNQVIADLLTIKTKTPDLSLYRIAKTTHTDISRIVKENQILNYYTVKGASRLIVPAAH